MTISAWDVMAAQAEQPSVAAADDNCADACQHWAMREACNCVAREDLREQGAAEIANIQPTVVLVPVRYLCRTHRRVDLLDPDLGIEMDWSRVATELGSCAVAGCDQPIPAKKSKRE